MGKQRQKQHAPASLLCQAPAIWFEPGPPCQRKANKDEGQDHFDKIARR